MQLLINTTTDGSGMWTNRKKELPIYKVEVVTIKNDIQELHELRAYFFETQWNINDLGLIYTDKRWLETFIQGLHFVAGLGWHALMNNAVMYSEQGMQGDDFVSMYVDAVFVKEWERVVELAATFG